MLYPYFNDKLKNKYFTFGARQEVDNKKVQNG